MPENDKLKESLLRLQEACAEVQRALSDVLQESPSAPAEGTTVTKRMPEPAAEPEPEPEPKDVFSRLRKFHARACAAGIDPSDVAFASVAGDRHAKLPEEKRGRLLQDCVRFLEDLLWKYHFLLSPELRGEVFEILREMAARAGMDVQEETLHSPSSEPEGSVLAEISPGRRVLSTGSSSPAADAFLEAARAVGVAPVENPSERAEALAALMKLWPRLSGADENGMLTTLRYAVNAIHPLGLRSTEKLVAFLEEQDIAQIPASPGATFDDSYKPNRYERRRVRSHEKRNTIVRILQRGFVGPDGVPIQRAVVAVSNGEG